MNKYKICVYAICKNEEHHVDEWVKSMSEADQIFVLDTGSNDNTMEKLKENGVIVKQKIITPWRFDIARNESLNMVPEDYDICVCTDLDERLNKGWRKELEHIWEENTTRCKYIYNWKLDSNNKPIVTFYYEKIHARKGFKWIYPVHEVLNYEGIESYVLTDNIVLNHYPDYKESRSNYLKLLELSVKENKDNDRNMHYLGREYMYHKKYNKAIDTLIKHLNLKSATWKDERSASMRFISRCYIKLNRINEAKMWLDMAIKETPYLRDPFIEKAMLEYNLKNYNEVINNCLNALKIENNNKSYINETFSFDHTVYDLLSIGYFYTGNFKKALEYINKALTLTDDERIKNNKEIIEKYL